MVSIGSFGDVVTCGRLQCNQCSVVTGDPENTANLAHHSAKYQFCCLTSISQGRTGILHAVITGFLGEEDVGTHPQAVCSC